MPKQHSANELRFQGSLLASDGATVVAAGVWYGLTMLSSDRRDASQHEGALTTHLFVFRAEDAATLSDFGYVQDEDGNLYIVDTVNDALLPRPGIWLEVYSRRVRAAS